MRILKLCFYIFFSKDQKRRESILRALYWINSSKPIIKSEHDILLDEGYAEYVTPKIYTWSEKGKNLII